MKEREVKERVYSTFANMAKSLGYSDVHGRIIACLLMHENPVSLSRVARETGYSSSMVSLSIDFLETVGMVKRVKKPGDRKLYLQSDGNLLDGIRKALLAKIEKRITDSLQEFKDYKKELNESKERDSKRVLNAIEKLEKEIKRTDRYIKILSKVELP